MELKEILQDVSDSDTPPASEREQIEYIDIGLIDGDPSNFYALTEVDRLAANIETVGLQQPLRVRSSEEDPGRVVIVSGHRRRAALLALVEAGREDLRPVPCIRERSGGSAALRELRLIYANSDTRHISSADLAKQAQRVELLLYQLKEEGYEFPGRMRDHVAQACKISAPKLARLKVIRENLVPEYMAMFEADELPEYAAYAMARFPADFQVRLYGLGKLKTWNNLEEALKKYNEGWHWVPQLTCPDGSACKRGDAFLRRDLNKPTWMGPCGGQKCCLECDASKSSSYPCENMCSKAKARRSAEKQATGDALQKKAQKNGRKYQEETQTWAKRLLPVLDRAGLADEEAIVWEYYDRCSISVIRQWAAGEFDDPANWHQAKLSPKSCRNPLDLARKLGCSADFLLGLSDNPDEINEESLVELAREEGRARAEAEFQTARREAQRQVLAANSELNDTKTALASVQRELEDTKFELDLARKRLERQQRPQPEGQLVICGWMPGGTTPAEDCEVVADFPINGVILRQACVFVDGRFHFRINNGGCGASIDTEPVRWMRLPPVEEET